jgi:quercetin dioxygenase-like cupin family protein
MKKYLVTSLLLLASSALAHQPRVVSAEDVTVVKFPGHDTYLLADVDSTPSEVAVLELELPPRTFGAPPHVHSNEDEHFYVLSGEVEFLSGEEVKTVTAGGLVVLPRGHIHGFWNQQDKPAKMLLVVTPGQFASFFDQVVAEIREANPGNPQLVGKIIAEQAAKFGVKVMPEKVPAAALPLLPE